MDIEKAYPEPVNVEKLAEELRASFPSVSMSDSGIRVHNVVAQDEITIDAILAAHNASILTTEQKVNGAQSGLKDKIAIAQTYATEIKSLFNICLEQFEVNSVYPGRYNAVKTLVDTFPTALKNRIHGGLLKDTGLDVSLITTDLQRGQYFTYTFNLATALALLLSQA